MAQEGFVKRLNVIIPVAIFFLSAIFAGITSKLHRDAIASIINKAGANSEPIMICPMGWAFPTSGYSYSILGLDGSAVSILPPGLSNSYYEYTYFEPDGTFVNVSESNLMNYSTGWDIHFSTTKFPDYVSHSARGKQVHVPESGNSQMNFMNYMGPGNTQQIMLHDFDIRWINPVDPYNSSVSTAQAELTLFDIRDGTISEITAGVDNSKAVNQLLKAENLSFTCSDDMSKMFFVELDPSNPGNPWMRSGGSPAGYNQTIWMLDTEEESWSDLYKCVDIIYLDCSPDGKYVATSSWSTQDVLIIDVDSGSLIAQEKNATRPAFSKNYLALYIVAGSGYSGQVNGLIVYDIRNNWNRIIVPSRAQMMGGLTPSIYEPPPNGLDGMYENFHE
jgi:hypothetical protein